MDFCPVQPSTKYYFPHRTLFHFISPHRPATWLGSRAGSPVFVSLVITVSEHTVTFGVSDSEKAYATPTYVHYARYLVLRYCLC